MSPPVGPAGPPAVGGAEEGHDAVSDDLIGRRWPPLASAALLVAMAVAGVVLRIQVLHSAAGVLDSDEAIVGLMARHVLHGEVRTFYWGQTYGGTPEVLLSAAAFSVFGSSPLALKSVAMLLDVAACLLVWRVGRRVVTEQAGRFAALLFWVWPGVFVWFSTKERAFYWTTVDVGLLAILLALRLRDDPRRWWSWLGLGLSTGVACWASVQVALVALPVAVYLVVVLRREAWRAVVAVPAFLAGVSPVLVYAVRTGGVALGPPQSAQGSYGAHLVTMGRRTLPVALGLRHPFSERWIPGGLVVFAVLVVGVVVAAGAGAGRRRGLGLVVGVVAAFPLVAAFSSASTYVGEGRYLLPIVPLFAIVLASAGVVLPVRLGLALGAVAVSVAGLSSLGLDSRPYAPDVPVPRRFAPLIHALDERAVRDVVADYWVAYRLDLEMHERAIAVPARDSRYPPYERQVRAAPTAAVVFVRGTKAEPAYAAQLATAGVPATRVVAGAFVVYLPRSNVWPVGSASP